MHEPAVGIRRAAPNTTLNLLAGQLYFGREASRVHTLLGSCVAVTLWHPQRRIGGMCHFLLPSRARTPNTPLDGRFGDEALALLMQALQREKTQPGDYLACLYGGADTLSDYTGVKLNVGARNIEQGWSLIDRYGFQLQEVDVGDHIPRNVSIDLRSGEVMVRRGSYSASSSAGAAAASTKRREAV